jgi:Domain of unknown function (DUF5666)
MLVGIIKTKLFLIITGALAVTSIAGGATVLASQHHVGPFAKHVSSTSTPQTKGSSPSTPQKNPDGKWDYDSRVAGTIQSINTSDKTFVLEPFFDPKKETHTISYDDKTKIETLVAHQGNSTPTPGGKQDTPTPKEKHTMPMFAWPTLATGSQADLKVNGHVWVDLLRHSDGSLYASEIVILPETGLYDWANIHLFGTVASVDTKAKTFSLQMFFGDHSLTIAYDDKTQMDDGAQLKTGAKLIVQVTSRSDKTLYATEIGVLNLPNPVTPPANWPTPPAHGTPPVHGTPPSGWPTPPTHGTPWPTTQPK